MRSRFRQAITAAVFLVLGALLGANLAYAATPNDTACRVGITTADGWSIAELQKYDACRADKQDAALSRIEKALSTPSPASSPSPTPTGSPAPSTTQTPVPTPKPSPSPSVATTSASPTPSPAPSSPGSWPTQLPARICGNSTVLNGPASAPSGATVVPAGDNSNLGFDFRTPGRTFWFAPGVHTIGNDRFAQIQPGDGSTFVGAPGAVLDGSKVAQYAFTQKAKNVTIKYLTVRNFVSPPDEGVVNHDAGSGWTMTNNTITLNGGGGMFLGPDNVARDNCLKDNGQYGFQGANGGVSGAGGMVLDHNEISGNNTDDWETKRPGCGCTGAGKFWDVQGAKITNNWIHDNHGAGVWADTNNNDFLIEGNWIENNDAQAIEWETSYNVTIRNNVLKHNLLTTGPKRIASGDNFPDAAVYLSESGGDARLRSSVAGAPLVDVTGNLFQDNYNGVTLWENADRYCSSGANTSTGYCTLVNPANANITTCGDQSKVSKEPLFSDCRWRTQNVKVHGNTFTMNPANFFGCRPGMCGRNAIFSNYGTIAPYAGFGVSDRIVASQGNVFSGNTYSGPWSFLVHDTAVSATSQQWQAAPYRQDAGSTFTG